MKAKCQNCGYMTTVQPCRFCRSENRGKAVSRFRGLMATIHSAITGQIEPSVFNKLSSTWEFRDTPRYASISSERWSSP